MSSKDSSKFTPGLDTALRAQLKALTKTHQFPKQTNPVRKNTNARDPMVSPMQLGEDGVDHINIWDHAKTDLGKALSSASPIPFKHSVFHRFNSMDCFWHYINSSERDDRIRTMRGASVRAFAKKLTRVNVPNFRAIIMDANYQKVMQYPEIAESLKSTTLPLDCWYVYKENKEVRIRPSFGYWLIKGFEEIRSALKEERAPDFTFLMDDTKIGIYDGVVAASKPAVKTPVAKPEGKIVKKPKAPIPSNTASVSTESHGIKITDGKHDMSEVPGLPNNDLISDTPAVAAASGSNVIVEDAGQARGQTSVIQHLDDAGVYTAGKSDDALVAEVSVTVEGKAEVPAQQ